MARYSMAQYDPQLEVNKFIQNFGKMDAIVSDSYNRMEKLGEFATLFIQEAGEVSALMTKSMKEIFSPDTPEFTAIKSFDNFVEQTFNAKIASILSSKNEARFRDVSTEYDTLVDVFIGGITSTVFEVAANNGTITENMFRRQCNCELSNPRHLLEVMKYFLVPLCPFQNILFNTENYVEAMNYFFDIEEKFGYLENSIGHYQYAAVKQEFLISLINLPNSEKVLNTLKENLDLILNNDFDNIISIIKLSTPSSSGIVCYSEAVIAAVDYKHVETIIGIRSRLLDLQILTIAAVMCADIRTDGSPTARKYELFRISQVVTEIINHTLRFVPEKLETAWSGGLMKNLTHNIVKNAVISKSWYQYYAYGISREVNARGLNHYMHQILITNPWFSYDRFHSLLDPQFGFKLENWYKSANIFVTRYKYSSLIKERSDRAAAWLAKNTPLIERTLAVVAHNVTQRDDCIEVRMALQKALNLTYLNDPHLCRSVVILHDYQLLNSKLEINTGIANLSFFGHFAFGKSEYHHNDWHSFARLYYVFWIL